MERSFIITGIILIPFTLLLYVHPALSAQLFDKDTKGELIESMGGAEINWTDQVLRVKGAGVPAPDAENPAVARLGAIRAAKLDALRNALETIKGVRIDSKTTMENFISASDTINAYVQGYVKGATLVDTKYMSDGSIEVIMEVTIPGLITKSILPDTGRNIDKIPRGEDSKYTGLIVDARGLNIRPAMAPKILDEDGREVYGSTFVSREYAHEMGIVGYTKGLSKTRVNDRVGDNPITVKGIKKAGTMASDVVISNKDALKLREAGIDLSFLEKCRVVFVVD